MQFADKNSKSRLVGLYGQSFLYTLCIMVNIARSESFFLKNVLISERNFVTLCIGIGVMSLFVSHLKVTHFLRHTQVSNAFFVPIYSRFY